MKYVFEVLQFHLAMETSLRGDTSPVIVCRVVGRRDAPSVNMENTCDK